MENKRLSFKDIIYIVIITLLIGGLLTTLFFALYKKENKLYETTYYTQKVSAFKVENANYSKGQIIFIGDSITDLYHLDDYYADLDLATYNRGIGGDVTSGVYARLKTSLYDIEPSKIVLMIGINDINGRVAKKTIINNYEKILNDIKINLPTAKLYAMSILPLAEDYLDSSFIKESTETIVSVNTEIQSLAERHGYQYCDLFSIVKDKNNHLAKQYSLDGIHLSEEGFIAWTNLMKPLLG